jgi:hypothetical protein
MVITRPTPVWPTSTKSGRRPMLIKRRHGLAAGIVLAAALAAGPAALANPPASAVAIVPAAQARAAGTTMAPADATTGLPSGKRGHQPL